MLLSSLLHYKALVAIFIRGLRFLWVSAAQISRLVNKIVLARILLRDQALLLLNEAVATIDIHDAELYNCSSKSKFWYNHSTLTQCIC